VRVLRSFRGLLILGSVLWTLGLLSIAHVLVLTLMPHVPALLYANHHSIVFLGLLFMFAGILAVRTSISSFSELKQQLVSVRSGMHDASKAHIRTKYSHS
jgi:hypothetical protein